MVGVSRALPSLTEAAVWVVSRFLNTRAVLRRGRRNACLLGSFQKPKRGIHHFDTLHFKPP